MRYLIPAMIVVALSLSACSPKNAPETAADVVVSAEVSAQPDEERIATGIKVDVCKLPKLSEVSEMNPPTLKEALASCTEDGNTTLEIGIDESVSIELNDSILEIYQGDSYQYILGMKQDPKQHSSMEAIFTSPDFIRRSIGETKVEEDLVMSERFGFKTFRVDYLWRDEAETDEERDEAETEEELSDIAEDRERGEGYCFRYSYADYCVAAISRGDELDAFKNAFLSNIKLVTKTKAELDREREEHIRQQQEESRKANEEAFEKYGGKPRIKFKNPEVRGNIDKRIIQKVVRQHSGELRACYENALLKTKGLNGLVAVSWIINASGEVETAEIKESTVGSSDVESCITESIKTWRFPAPKGGGKAQIDYPFELEVSTDLPAE